MPLDLHKLKPGAVFKGEFSKEDNKSYTFQMTLLSVSFYHNNTISFMARGEDTFGDSGIVGKIHGNEILFYKTYVNTERIWKEQQQTLPFSAVDHRKAPNFERNLRLLKYFGEIFGTDSKIFAQGGYEGKSSLPGSWKLILTSLTFS